MTAFLITIIAAVIGFYLYSKQKEVPSRNASNSLTYGMQEKSRDAFDEHLALHWKIVKTYKKRNSDPEALQRAIELCKKQIEMAEKAKRVWLEEERVPLPSHTGYKQLCIILEKNKKFEESIKLAKQAKSQGWMGDWDKRIKRCRRKKNKES